MLVPSFPYMNCLPEARVCFRVLIFWFPLFDVGDLYQIDASMCRQALVVSMLEGKSTFFEGQSTRLVLKVAFIVTSHTSVPRAVQESTSASPETPLVIWGGVGMGVGTLEA